MRSVLIVGIGSFIGGVLRYQLSTWVHRIFDNPWFPFGTLAVNVGGCFLMGFLAGLGETRSVFTSEARLLLFIGMLGGFTTYSSFAFETFSLARDTQIVAASMNIALQLVLGLGSLWIGNVLTRFFGG